MPTAPRGSGCHSVQHGPLAIVRIVFDMHDHVAHRLIAGLRPGVGIGTCDAIAQAVVTSGLNYRDIFYNALPGGVFTGRALAAVNHARQVCATIAAWQRNDTLQQRLADTSAILNATFNAAEAGQWQAYALQRLVEISATARRRCPEPRKFRSLPE